MKVKLVKESKHGPVGKVLTHEGAWRLCFPVKGCVGKCVDSEAVAAALAEIETVSGTSKARLLSEMESAGTVPDEVDIEVAPAPKAQPKKQPIVTEIPPPKKESHVHSGTSAQSPGGSALPANRVGESGKDS